MQNKNFLTKSRWLVTIFLLISLSITYAMGADATPVSYDGADLADWSGTHSGQYKDGSLKLDATGENAYKDDIWSGVVSSNMTSIAVTINYKINGTSSSSNVFTIAAINSSGVVKASVTFAPTSTSATDVNKTLTIPASSAVTGLKITYTTKSSGNVGVYSLSATATYTPAASCGTPSDLTKGAVNSSSQTVSWTAPSSAPANGYLVAYSTATSTDPSSSVYSTSGNYTVEAVTSGTSYNIPCNTAGTYNWWVRSKCSTDNSSLSDWVKGTVFTMKQIYLQVNDNWAGDNAKFCAYYWGVGDKTGFTKIMTPQTDCEGKIYTCVFPTDYSSMKFVRLDPVQIDPVVNFDNQWNGTGNLSLAADKNYYQITGGTGGDVTGSWSTYAQKVTVSFDKNTTADKVTDPADQCVVKTTGHATAPTIANMSHDRLGYQLAGWYTAAEGGSAWNFATGTFSGDQTLHAHWSVGATTTIALNPTWTGDGNTWDKDNYIIYAHFYIDGTDQFEDVLMTKNVCDGIYTAAAPYGATHVSFARCKPGTTLPLGTWESNSNVTNYVTGLEIAANYQYKITGWGSGKVGTAQKESGAYTPSTFTISYDKGTGSGDAMSSTNGIACDVNQAVSANTYTKTGHHFTNWTSDVTVTVGGATTTSVGDGATIQNIRQNIALTAQWAANTYTVTYNKNGGGDGTGTADQAFTYGVAQELRSCGFTAPEAHKYFAGWDESSSAVNPTYSAGQSVSNLTTTHEGTVTLYAIWKDHTFTNYRTLCADVYDIVLDDGLVPTTNNGSAKVADKGTTLTTIVAPTKNGYDVDYYCTNSDLGTKIAEATGALSASITVSGNNWTDANSKWILENGATFFTKWKVHNYTLTYEGLEGATHSNPNSYNIETTTITLTDPSARAGYTFTGWTCGGDAITQITLGSTGDKTITANWTINKHTVAVSSVDHVMITATPAGGSTIAEGSSASNVNYGTTVTLNCTPDEHWSLAWDVYKTGESSTKVALTGDGDGATFTLPDYNVTVAAVMTEATYHTATFKNNGAVIDGYDAVKTYDGERPSAPTLTDITDACDKTDCNKFYGWIAEAGIWDKTINSVAGKTIYRNASSIPVVSGADVVYHAVWAKGTGVSIEPTLIAKWDKQALTASTAVYAKDKDGNTLDGEHAVTLTSNIDVNDNDAIYGYSEASIGSEPVITISGLNFSGYSGGTITFYARASSQTTFSATYSTNKGVSYSALDWSDSAVKTEYSYIITVPNNTTDVKITYAGNSGNFYFGTVRVYGDTDTDYDFTELTSSNTSGWSGADWDGYYLITGNSSAKALRSDVMDGMYGKIDVTPSTGVITTDDLGLIFKVTYNSSTSKYVIQSIATLDYLTDNAGGYGDKATHLLEPSSSEYYSGNDAITYDEITNTSGYYVRWNSDRFGSYASCTKPTIYKALDSYTEFRITCCDKTVTIGNPTKTGSGTVTFASGGETVAVGGTVETCAGATTITATVTPTNGYQCTALEFTRSDAAALTPSPAISVPFTGAQSYDLTFEQNADGVTLNTTVTFVALIDHYIDNMHYNTTQNKSGNYGTAPTLSDESKGEQCTGLHYKFIGWIPETDMNMTTGVPTTTANMVAGGATGKYATGTNYYAIWAEEE